MEALRDAYRPEVVSLKDIYGLQFEELSVIYLYVQFFFDFKIKLLQRPL